MSNNLSKDRHIELMTQLGEIALELGWIVAVPPTDMIEGLVMGTVKYVSDIDDLLDDDNKLDALIHDDQLAEIEKGLSEPTISDKDLEDNLISTNIMPSRGIPKKGGHNVH